MRTVLSLFVMVLCALLGFAGCHKKDPVSTDGTGVQGLDTPDQILSNPYVRDALDAASDEGVNITPEKGVKPPVISGTYDFTGQVHVQGYPGWHTLTPGTWKWSNQTSDNKIDTDYDQGMQTGGGVKGEIIRGTGNRFTVYSVLDISDEYCDERAIALIDGEQEDNGNIRANYIITPAADPVCHAPTIGYLELTLTGAAKAAVNESGGAFLMMILKDASSELHFNETNK